MIKNNFNKKALLLDMNSTFMFGEDRFGPDEDFSLYYKSIGGSLPAAAVNRIIRATYDYLDSRYPDVQYRECFPSLQHALVQTLTQSVSVTEMQKLLDTFAYHEHGYITAEYLDALFRLHQHFQLALVIDIWSPKQRWLDTFTQLGIDKIMSAMSFSSDHGIVKPSAQPFLMIVEQLQFDSHECVVVGDSTRRDLGGANAAGIDCILVGGARHPAALACHTSLLELCHIITTDQQTHMQC